MAPGSIISSSNFRQAWSTDVRTGAVIITRTPLRISIGGGGTDLSSYYSRRGGFVISAAIDKYVFISINQTFTNDYFLKYSKIERAATLDEIEHPLIRESLRLHGVPPALELVSTADMPAGTGLGSSGTFTVGLLKAIHAFRRIPVAAHDLAEEACHVEIDLLGEPCGKQDQYIASFGGLTCFDFAPDGAVRISALRASTETINDLETHLLLFFTGYSRRASTILGDQRSRSESGEAEMLDGLDHIKDLGVKIKECLEAGDCTSFAELMHEHWMAKRERSPDITNSDIDRWYNLAMANGALGGKLVGAGAGGFLMLYAKDPRLVRESLGEAGLREVPFRFDMDGSIVLARS
jgi:D-glycero-alpha-D-manno-heptose-7-phosphate kinase